MATRRIRPSRPLAPHGLPGHLVGFVEAFAERGFQSARRRRWTPAG